MKISKTKLSEVLGVALTTILRYYDSGRIVIGADGEPDVDMMIRIVQQRGRHSNEKGKSISHRCSDCGLLMSGRVCKVSGYVRAADDVCPFL